MFESKYSKVLTVILVIVIVAILALLGFLGYDVYSRNKIKKVASNLVDDFETSIQNKVDKQNVVDTNTDTDIPVLNEIPVLEENTVSEENTDTSSSSVTYKGYTVVGTIEIPAISLKYPVLERVTGDSIEIAVAVMYGPGLNKVGNTVIAGHNYRNGSFFGNNDKLKIGDVIYITDSEGTRIKYSIYNIYETDGNDSDFINRDTNGRREISLSTCTDNSQARLIIWAVEE